MFEVTIVISQQFETRSDAAQFVFNTQNSMGATLNDASVNITIDKVQAEGEQHAN